MAEQQQRVVSLPHVVFLRWLADRGRLEHRPSGPPSGPVARLLEEWRRKPWATT